MGGKSKSVTVGYKHYLGEHMVLCHGPIDYIERIQVDERTAWGGQNTGGSIVVNAAELFGGESREGGVSGTVDIAMGGPAQTQNSYLVSVLGSDVPAYRGVVSAILRKCYLGNNPYLKKWNFRGSRIHVRQNGVDQWYDDAAEIVGIAPGEPTASYSINLDAVTNGATSPSGGLSVGVAITGLNATDVLVIRPNLAGPHVAFSPWGDPSPVSGSSGAVYNFKVIRNGDTGNTREWSAGATFDGYAAARTGFMARYPNGVRTRGASSYEFYIEDSPVGDNSGGISLTVDVYPGASIDMNPAHIIRECLTDPDWGMGYQDSDIDDESFEAAADTLFDEGLGMSLLWDKQIQIDAFVQEIVRHIDAALYVDRTTGKFVLKLIRADYDVGTLISLDESNVAKVTNPSKAAFGELINSVTVNYWDAATGKDASLTVQDTALVQTQGQVIGTTMQYPGFTYAVPAGMAAQRDLRALSNPFLTCTIYTDSTAKDLNIGDVFKFSWGRWKITDMVMRVISIAFADGKSRQVRITCTQDVYSTPATAVVVPNPGTGWVDPSGAPAPFEDSIAFEAPYLELVQTLGEADTNSTLAGKSDIGYVMGAAPRPASAINGRLWTDSGAGYADVSGLDFCPYAVLDADIGKTDTVLDIADDQDLDQVELGTWCQIGEELMRVDAIDTGAGTITVGRGVLDTVPDFHTTGDGIFFWDQFSGYDPTEYVEGEEVDAKLQPVSGAGVVALTAITPQTVAIMGRPNRPYPPGDFKVNGLSYDEGPYSGELTISWVHRDRLQQTSGTLADHFDGGIGPEAGTTYRLRGYIDDVLSHTEDDIAGTNTTWEPGLTGFPVRVEVHSKRDGVYSYQAPWHEFEYGDAPATDPYWDYVAFLMYGEGADGSSTFTDRSRFARTATAVGGAVVDTDITVGSNPSILLGADGRHVRRDHGYELNINSDGPDFCMEAYVYCTDITQNNQIFGRRRNSDNFILGITNDALTFSTFNGTTGTSRLNVAAGMSNNTVHHVAVIRVGTTYYGFVDGVLKGSNTSATSMGINSTSLYVGESESDQSARYWRGNVNWCRLTIGHKRYDEAGFTPPALPLATGYPTPAATPADPTFSNVKLLCGFNGTDGATAFTDESSAARTATFVGNAQLDTAQSKFGTASLLLDGTGDYVTFPDASDLKIPTAAGALWTLEAWVRATGSWKTIQTIASKRNGSGQGEFSLDISAGAPRFFALNSGTSCVSITSPDALSLDEWHHIAISATSGFYRLFANGKLVAFGARDATPTTNTTALHIGRDPSTTARDWAGWIDEVRYTRGQAIYTESFTPPGTAFPRS